MPDPIIMQGSLLGELAQTEVTLEQKASETENEWEKQLIERR